MKKIKKIPYGESDFKKIRKGNYYYIDKTKYIELIEDSPSFLFLIRPRRFGKSLFLSILESYYDIYYKDEFETIFKDTYIGENPTEERNKYLVLKFNFAEVDPRIENTEKSFSFHCNKKMNTFVQKYKEYFTNEQLDEINKTDNILFRIGLIFEYGSTNNLKLYLIIDEYDNFTNSILASSGIVGYENVTREKSGFFKHFFNVIKAGATATDASVSKVFITGVSPITLDDVTSGGIGHNITTDLQFNEFIGFTEQEVKEILLYYQKVGKINMDINIILRFMKKWYNNYKFSDDAEHCLFNSTMVLNFLVRYLSSEKFPKQLIDDNTKIDYSKLKHLLVLDTKLNGNFSILREILKNNQITAKLKGSFPVNKITERDNFISLIFYFGLITITDYKEDKYVFRIPNEAVKDFFINYIKEGFEDAGIFRINLYKYSNLMTEMAYRGKWQDVFLFLSNAIKEQSQIKDYIRGESMIKGFLLAYLNLTNNYTITSEKELNKGIADLWLEPVVTTHAKANYSYLIELKYNKRTEKGISDKQIQSLIKEATTQLKHYEKDPIIIKEKSSTTVKKIVLVYNAWELVYWTEIV